MASVAKKSISNRSTTQENNCLGFKIIARVITNKVHTSVVEYTPVDQHWCVVLAYLMAGKITQYEGHHSSIEEYLRAMLFDIDETGGRVSFGPNDDQVVEVDVIYDYKDEIHSGGV